MSDKVLQVKNVIKSYGDYKASNNISFDVMRGTVFGLLGPNGAGKTTLIRLINNIYVPDEGEILIFDEKLNINHLNKMAYLPEERGLYKKLKVIDQLVYFGKLKGMSTKDASFKAKEWLIRLEANEWINKKVQELSKGMQQKIQFIASILHDPQFIILDEPFSGFDPINAEVLKSIILDLKKEGKTIILSTHLMEQVEQLCDEIALINKGKLVLSGNVREIKQKNKTNLYTLEYDGNNEFIEEFNEITIINKYNNRFDFSINDNIDIKLLINKINNLTNIIKFEHSEPKLNDIFINVVKNNNI